MLVLTMLSVSVVLVIGIGLYYKSIPVLNSSILVALCSLQAIGNH